MSDSIDYSDMMTSWREWVVGRSVGRCRACANGTHARNERLHHLSAVPAMSLKISKSVDRLLSAWDLLVYLMLLDDGKTRNCCLQKLLRRLSSLATVATVMRRALLIWSRGARVSRVIDSVIAPHIFVHSVGPVVETTYKWYHWTKFTDILGQKLLEVEKPSNSTNNKNTI